MFVEQPQKNHKVLTGGVCQILKHRLLRETTKHYMISDGRIPTLDGLSIYLLNLR